MAYKNFYIDGGFINVGYLGYQVSYTEIELRSQRIWYYIDEDGNQIAYDYPMFRHLLEPFIFMLCQMNIKSLVSILVLIPKVMEIIGILIIL